MEQYSPKHVEERKIIQYFIKYVDFVGELKTQSVAHCTRLDDFIVVIVRGTGTRRVDATTNVDTRD